MKRAILMALGTGALISSAAAIGIGMTAAGAHDPGADVERTRAAARDAQRTRVEARYQEQRAQCQAQGGLRRDKCAVAAHAERGRALLDISAPYATRYGF